MSNRGTKSSSPNTILLAAGAAVSALGLGYLAYRFFAPKPAFDVKDLILVLNHVAALYREVEESLEEQRMEISRHAENASPEQVEQLQRAYNSMVRKVTNDNMHLVFDKHGITREQLEAAIVEHKDNATVVFLVSSLPVVFFNGEDDAEDADEVDDADLPDLETVTKAMSLVLELSIKDMEDIYTDLVASLPPSATANGARPQSNPVFANALARAYTEKHQQSRRAALEEMGLNEKILGRAARKFSDSEELKEVVVKHLADKRERFTALGIFGKSDDGASAGAAAAGAAGAAAAGAAAESDNDDDKVKNFDDDEDDGAQIEEITSA